MTDQVLLDASEFLNAHKWGSGRLLNERTGAYCALGVIGRVVGVEERVLAEADDTGDNDIYDVLARHESVKRLAAYLAKHHFDPDDDYWIAASPTEAIWSWNDDATEDEVKRVFREAGLSE